MKGEHFGTVDGDQKVNQRLYKTMTQPIHGNFGCLSVLVQEGTILKAPRPCRFRLK